MNSLMTGQGQTSYNDYLSSLQNTTGAPSQINPQTIQAGQATATPVNAQGVNPATSQAAAPINAQQINPQTSNIDFNSLINQQYGVNQPNLSNILHPTNFQNQPQIDFSALANITGNQANLAQAPGQFSYQNQAAPTASFDDPMVKALSDYANQNLNQNVNTIRERFTAGGGTGMGTPAAFAEATTRAQGTTDLANALAGFAQNQQGIQLQNNAMNMQGQQNNNALNSNNALTARGQDLQNYLGQQGINLSALQSMQSNQLGQRGQDLGAQLQAAGIDAQTAQALASGLLQQGSQQLQGQQLQGQQQQTLAQLMGQQGQFNAGQTNAGQLANQGADLQSLLANQAMQQQTNLANQGAINQGNQFNSAQNMQGQLANQNNSQSIQLANLQAALQAAMSNQSTNLTGQQANAQNQLQGQGNQINLAQLFGQSAGLTQQGQLGAIQQLFNSFNQGNALGTPQAQTIQKPSAFQNFMSGAQGIASLGASVAPLFL